MSAAPSTEMAVNARRIDFTSQVNGRAYRLLVSEPAGEPPAEGWPVIYLIDGALHFGITVDTVRIQSRWPDTREAVVVGIGYPTDSVIEALTVRNLDLTPPIAQATLDADWQRHMKAKAETFGGMDAYLQVLDTEVKPRAAEAARIDPTDQTLMGHSLGGLTTLTALLRTPEAFQTYVAVSPSIWFSQRWVLGLVEGFEAKARAGGVRVRALISAGEWESGESSMPSIPKAGLGFPDEAYREMMRECRIVEDARALVQRIQGLPGVEARFVEHLEEDHRSVVPAGIARGVAFSLYRP